MNKTHGKQLTWKSPHTDQPSDISSGHPPRQYCPEAKEDSECRVQPRSKSLRWLYVLAWLTEVSNTQWDPLTTKQLVPKNRFFKTEVCTKRNESTWTVWWLFPRLRGFWENVPPFIPRLHSFFSFSFFEVEINSCTLIPLFRPGSVHSGSASWDHSGWVFPDKLCVSSFPDWFPHYAWTAAA